jgi:hypothetical protein
MAATLQKRLRMPMGRLVDAGERLPSGMPYVVAF